MNIEKVQNGECTTLKFNGWLDVESAPQLHAYMETLDDTRVLVFDFKDLEYISSAGLREVVATYRRQKEKQGEFSICNMNSDVQEIFRMTGLDKKIRIE